MRNLTSEDVKTLGDLIYGPIRWQAEMARDMGCEADTVGRALARIVSPQFSRRLSALARTKASDLRGRASQIDMLLIDASEPENPPEKTAELPE